MSEVLLMSKINQILDNHNNNNEPRLKIVGNIRVPLVSRAKHDHLRRKQSTGKTTQMETYEQYFHMC